MTIEGIQEQFVCPTCGEEHAYPLFDALLAKTGSGLPRPFSGKANWRPWITLDIRAFFV